jgi:hypothetical protein
MSAGDRELIERARSHTGKASFQDVLKDCHALADRLEAREGWREIESAPKDGRLIYVATDHPAAGLMVDRFGAAVWDSDLQGGGFWLHGLPEEPTHWRPMAWPFPLPPAPERT